MWGGDRCYSSNSDPAHFLGDPGSGRQVVAGSPSGRAMAEGFRCSVVAGESPRQEEHSAGHGEKSQPEEAGGLREHRAGKISPRGYCGISSFFEKNRKRKQAPGASRPKKSLGVGACARGASAAGVNLRGTEDTCQGQGGPAWLREERLSPTTRGIRSAIPRIQGDGGTTPRGRGALLGETWRLDEGVWSWSCFSSSSSSNCTHRKKMIMTHLCHLV